MAPPRSPQRHRQRQAAILEHLRPGGATAAPWTAPPSELAARAAAAGHGGMTTNRVLADRHRVILGGWPISGAIEKGDARAASAAALFDHCKVMDTRTHLPPLNAALAVTMMITRPSSDLHSPAQPFPRLAFFGHAEDAASEKSDSIVPSLQAAGYDGLEVGCEFFKPFYPGASLAEVVGNVRMEIGRTGVEVPGVLLQVTDLGSSWAPPADAGPTSRRRDGHSAAPLLLLYLVGVSIRAERERQPNDRTLANGSRPDRIGWAGLERPALRPGPPGAAAGDCS